MTSVKVGPLRIERGGRNEDLYDWRHMYQSYLRVVRPGHNVLEIGASNPSRTLMLARHCREYIGVEYFPDRLLKPHGNMRFVAGDWQRLTDVIEPESIDVAIASHVIEHIPDDTAAIRELHRVLRTGGTALLNTPNRKRLPRAIIEKFAGERKFPWWEHVREYVEPDLVALLENSPFQSYAITPVVFGLHGGSLLVYFEGVPQLLRRYANFWEICLTK